MKQAQTHTDTLDRLKTVECALEGHSFKACLNAPYSTLPDASRVRQANHLQHYVRDHNYYYAHIRGNQIYASPTDGILIAAYLDENLLRWQIPSLENVSTVIIPLDSAVYCVDYDRDTGVTDWATEKVIAYGEAVNMLNQPLNYLILPGGLLTEEFDIAEGLPQVTHRDIAQYRLRNLYLELLRARLPTTAMLAQAAIAAGIVAAVAFLIYRVSFSPEPLTVPNITRDLAPRGVDTAVSELVYLDAIFKELDYFADKQLSSVDYLTDTVTISGFMPDSATLGSLVRDARAANLPLSFDSTGWRFSTRYQSSPQPPIDLRPFSDTFIALQQYAELAGASITLSQPVEESSRLTANVTIDFEIPDFPPIDELAKTLVGHASDLSTLQLEFSGQAIPQTSTLTIQIFGLP